MAKKKRIRLNQEQKLILKHLEWFIKNKIIWVGEQDLKDTVLDGHWAVFSIRGDPYKTYAEHWTFDCFDTLLMADSKRDAEIIVKWNMPTHALIVNIRWFNEAKEIRNAWKPEFNFSELG
jgi:hypothetical protein